MPETRVSSTIFKALLVRSGDSWCALPLTRIQRLLSGVKLFPLPGASVEIAGLAEVEGEPVVVLSLERLLGSTPGAAADFPVVLLVEAGQVGAAESTEIVGLLVDEAEDLITVDEEQIVGPARGLVRGEIRLGRSISSHPTAGLEGSGGVTAVRVLDLGALGVEE